MTTLTQTATIDRQDTTHAITSLSGRTLLASLFLVSGLGKIAAYGGTTAYMASAGVPGSLLPLVILAEVGGALALIAGLRTRIVASLLAAFAIVSALLFHADFGDQVQQIMFLKNLSIAGGLLVLAANGAGRFSLDARRTG